MKTFCVAGRVLEEGDRCRQAGRAGLGLFYKLVSRAVKPRWETHGAGIGTSIVAADHDAVATDGARHLGAGGTFMVCQSGVMLALKAAISYHRC
jgi:hypothetical protein